MLTREQKKQLISDLSDKLKKIKSAVFVDYQGLKVSQLKELRGKLRTAEAELKVAKKTLIDLALKEAGMPGMTSKNLAGQIALAFDFKDEVSAAKVLNDFSKKNESLKILGAILEGKFLEKEEALALARIPSREQSLANLVGSINAPLQGIASVLQANLRNFVFALSQIKH
ncbi:MAG: 50S ribosomal protein L10 [Candidatus Portnoybacteria bacterium]|nr:50S ribosomal protein L10 [Candidatus Portnoybacteria bacterium]